MLQPSLNDWSCVHKLNSDYVELACVLSITQRAVNRLLNPLALECMCQNNKIDHKNRNAKECSKNKGESKNNQINIGKMHR